MVFAFRVAVQCSMGVVSSRDVVRRRRRFPSLTKFLRKLRSLASHIFGAKQAGAGHQTMFFAKWKSARCEMHGKSCKSEQIHA
jgi:hypothetical protein